jgi:aerobic-type carbon monoxide dehydrogenase small subunit (CoxS/CutS family)
MYDRGKYGSRGYMPGRERSGIMSTKISFTLNNKPVTLDVEDDRKLLWVLRTELGLTGVKFGCGEGICGACTVLLNNRAMRSCQVDMKDVNGAEVITIEGLERNGQLHPLQKAFMEYDALQCGFCTPGMIMRAHNLLSENPNPTRQEVIDGMENNLCRCGAHTRIIDAILSAAEEMKGGSRS